MSPTPTQMRTFSTFSKRLITWYKQYGRHDLPWQKNPTPYRVWISEIMLQQTQVMTVIPYYLRFMQQFPTVAALAKASQDDVLAHWSGLGYYARARNIHKTARIIHQDHDDIFPNSVEALSALPGIGQSTAGAIVSFSMQKKAVILDGNVRRVLTRHFGIADPVDQKNTIDTLWTLATSLTPKNTAHHYNQAIMDLGATLCTRSKPRCNDCPFMATCIGYQEGQPTAYPAKTVKKARPLKTKRFLIIQNKSNAVLLLKRPTTGIWGGLWSLPEYELQSDYLIFQHDNTTLQLRYQDEMEKIIHQFTHFTLEIYPMILTVKNKTVTKFDSEKMLWYKLDTPFPGGIAAPVNKILTLLRATHE